MRRSKKKGSLNLSINAIVVLILAITMLGLGLGFMRNMFGGASKQFSQVTDEIQRDMVDRLKDSGKKIVLNTYEVKMKQSSKETIYLAISNQIDAPGENSIFSIDINNGNTIGDARCVGKIDTLENPTVSGGDAKVAPIIIQTDAKAEGTCEYNIVIKEDGADFGVVDFLITVS